MLDTAKLFTKAQEAFNKRNYDYAIDLARQIIDLKPDDAPARQMVRNSTFKSVELKGKLPGKVAGALFGLIPSILMLIFKVLKKPHKVLPAAESYLAKNPAGIWGRRMMGMALKDMNYIDSAILEFEGILTLNPREFSAAKALGELYHLKKDIKKSQRYYQLVLSIKPDDAEAPRALKNLAALTSLGQGWSQAKNARDMIRDKSTASSLEEASQLTGAGGVAGEIQRLQELVKQKPDNPQNVKHLKKIGELYLRSRDYVKAEAAYRQASQLSPADASLSMKIGDIKLLVFDKQLKEIRKKLTAQPQDAQLQQNFKKIQQTKRQFQVEEYRRRVKAHPTDLSLHFQLGVALYVIGQVDSAASEFQNTIRDPKRRMDSYNYLGCCFMLKKHFDLAVTQFQKALAGELITPDQDKNIRYNLARTFEQSGDKTRAVTEYKKIMEIDINYKDVTKKVEQLRG